MIYIALAVRDCLRHTGCLIVAAVLWFVLLLAPNRAIDVDPTQAHGTLRSFVCAVMMIAWLVVNLLGGVTSNSVRRGPLRELQSPIATVGGSALVAWRLGSVVAVVALSTAFIPIELALFRSSGPNGVPFVEILFAGGGAAAVVLLVATLTAVLPRAAAVAASGGWLLLSSHAAESASSSLERALTAPVFPLSRALLYADETARLSGSLRAAGSVALFDVGLLALLVAIEMRRPS